MAPLLKLRSLDRLHIWQKLALLGLVFALLFAVPTTLFLRQVAGGLAQSSHELAGLERAQSALALLRTLGEHRALSAAALGGDASQAAAREKAAVQASTLFAGLQSGLPRGTRPATIFDGAANAWKALSEGVKGAVFSAHDSNASHAELIATVAGGLEAMLDVDGLAVDSNSAVNHAARSAFLHVPALAESLGQAEAHGIALLSTRTAGKEERETLSALLQRAKERDTDLRSAIRKVLANAPSMQAALAPRMLESDAALARAIKSARVDVVFSQDLSRRPADFMADQHPAIDAQVNLAGALAQEVRTMLQARATEQRLQIILAIVAALAVFAGALWLAVWTTRSIARPLAYAVRVADGIAEGHLDHAIDASRAKNAEAARLLMAFNAMQASLSELMREVQSVSGEMRHAAAQVAEGNSDLSARTENQASSLEETAATMEELTSTVKRNADNAAEAGGVVTRASETAMRGAEAVSGVTSTMQSINSSSKRVVDIIGVIDSIAFQTNILALNAAVEAARAGEQGRGFAVVASEVRSLAHRSAEAAKEIKKLIADSVQAAAQGSKRVDEAGRAMDDIMDSVKQVAAIFAEISSASREQGNGIEQVNRAVTQMDRATQENAALVGEVAASSQSLQEQAERLAEVVARFRLAASAVRAEAVAAPRVEPRDLREPAFGAIPEEFEPPRLTAAE
ncbi:MAG TPA: methyl-accepting chemotaxis protein [Usitatibacter sp.]|jgi:methyl-accepting chemotaxis protein|nr:methyl-accepting chemotaxis protein [Usitatibacter sp.]